MIEEWKEINGYEGLYEVSNTGFIRSVDRVLTYNNGVKTPTRGKEIKIRYHSGGYGRIILSKDNIPYSATIHRLVMTTFVPNPDGLPCINHKDFNKRNNSIENLEWCTRKHNTQHIFDNDASKIVKIKLADASYIKANRHIKTRILAEKYGVTVHQINNIKKGKCRKNA